MIRRSPLRTPLLLAVGVLSAVALSACTNTGDDAARVDDTSLPDSEFEDVLSGLQDVPGLDSAALDENTVDANAARDLLTRWIETTVLEGDLADRGIDVTDETRDEVDQLLADANGDVWTEAPEALRSFYLDVFAVQQTFSEASAPDDADLKAVYDEGIVASGYACVRHILVASEDEAAAVAARLEAGEDFAALAEELSTDTGSAALGGILSNSQTGDECFTTAEFEGSFIEEFVRGAEEAEVGVPTAPVESQFGWHVILVRPFDEVAEFVRAVAGSEAALARQTELMTGADAWVASKYGKWSSELGAVVPIELPGPTTTPATAP